MKEENPSRKANAATETMRISSLKFAEWPESSRLAWQQATQPGSRLKRGGKLAHLAPVTQSDLGRRYGQFLDHVQRTSGQLPPLPEETVTPASVDSYIEELQARVSSVTLHGSIAKLRVVAEVLCPEQDWHWLREIANDLEHNMRPASKFHRIVDSQDIVRAGLQLMHSAQQVRNRVRRAEVFRNGLMIAFLAVCPIRLRSFSGLTIGKSLIRLGDGWHVKLSTSETKERRTDERPLPAFLSPFLEEYLQVRRPVFSYKGPELWCGRTKTALQANTVARILTATTTEVLGKPISPHLFRTCAASTAYQYAGTIPHLASALLSHRSPEVTEQHYNRARSITFSNRYGALIDNEVVQVIRRARSR